MCILAKKLNSFLKRAFDIAASLYGLIVLSPVMFFVAIFVKCESPGPVFYLGKRTGRYGIPFRIIKFRTMVAEADKMGGGPSCADDDPRITKFGRFLRKYKLNELPQLINVLKGNMSFVGPRPEVKFYTDMFTEEEKAILSVRPGITDWASIWNPDEGKVLAEVSAKGQDSELYYEENIRPQKIKLQLYYVRKRSFWVDMKILFETVKVLFK
ncbi:UDP-N-acetylgalactosamine-undecaprenyl-phosphate N-acetylgalactosaminephosphotransferase [subsurface metagenome]